MIKMFERLKAKRSQKKEQEGYDWAARRLISGDFYKVISKRSDIKTFGEQTDYNKGILSAYEDYLKLEQDMKNGKR